MRYLAALVMASSAILLAACGSSSPHVAPSSLPASSPQQSSGSPQEPSGASGGSSQQPSGPPDGSPSQQSSAAVTGTITWPNGNPAASTRVFWYQGDYSQDSPNPIEQQPEMGNLRHVLGVLYRIDADNILYVGQTRNQCPYIAVIYDAFPQRGTSGCNMVDFSKG